MNFYSTNNKSNKVSLKEAVTKGLASDGGLFMPEYIPVLDDKFIKGLSNLSFHDIAFEVGKQFFSSDFDDSKLYQLISDALNFEIPLKKIKENLYSLELFHGPTCAFKDIGARFMARVLKFYAESSNKTIRVLVATSGDTGSAVANGFLGIEGIEVIVLYPKGLVSEVQEKQFTTLGQNIKCFEIKGTFDDCQKIVKQAFVDKEITEKLTLASANSINIARLIPQSFYYFWGYAQMPKSKPVTVCVPSGNFGNLTAGLLAHKMGLPVSQFVCSTNVNDIVPNYLLTGQFKTRASVATVANAMDVGNPSNFARILDLYDHNYDTIKNLIKGYSYSDDDIKNAIDRVYKEYNYILDPHGATGFLALEKYQDQNDSSGFFIETAHPAKFPETVEPIIQKKVEVPERLMKFFSGTKKSQELPANFIKFKEAIL